MSIVFINKFQAAESIPSPASTHTHIHTQGGREWEKESEKERNTAGNSKR